ncbi:MAG TPA: exodeoxyribonuclease VII small subunit [Burkholderiales bacterium]|jgi:exodeoxyribonuclease VII small subunit
MPKPSSTVPQAPEGKAAPVGSGPAQLSVESGPLSFEGALAELEAIVARMESGELTLEQALGAYKRGAELLQFCQAALKDAQQQVKILEAGLLQDFTGGAEQD